MIARRAYAIVRVASLLAAVAVLVVAAPSMAVAVRPDALWLAGSLAVAIALSALRAPVAHFERSPRPAPDSERVGLLGPVVLALFATEGWAWAAAAAFLAALVRPPQARRRSRSDRLLHAALRVPPWIAVAALQPYLHAAVVAPLAAPRAAAFLGLGVAITLAVDLLWIDPLMAARQGRAIVPVWTRHLRDLPSLLAIVAESAWAFVAARVAVHDGPLLGLAVLVPLVVLAAVLVRFARTNARLHRLSISRAAVDAMLRANDPEPQMRSLLESVDPRIVRESVEIAAFGRGGGERWSRVVRFGPQSPPALERLGARALREVQATADEAEVDDEDGTVRAYPARDGEGRLRGALLVFRPPGATALVAGRELERAAGELGQLLREYGAIAATRTAASVDALTGLANRRGVARPLQDAMSYVGTGGRYAVLLLDVDHFKSINDLLGHSTGDRVLSRIGHIIAQNIRGVDTAARFGGEEFLVLLRDAARERALHVAERLRGSIEAGGLAYADGKPVTVSVGVAYVRPGDVPAEVVERADRALYRAKNAGRNRVVEALLAG